MQVKMRCNRKVFREDSGKIVTERTFVSTDREGKQLNEGVIAASYNDTIVGDSEDNSVVMHGVVTFDFDSAEASKPMAASAPAAEAPRAGGPGLVG